MTEHQICNLKTSTLEILAEDESAPAREREIADEELKRRGFDRAEYEARYGVSGRDDESLNPIGSYAS